MDANLQRCDKVALILPDHNCRRVAARKRNVDVYIGKETLLDSCISFHLRGFIPFYIFSRIVSQISRVVATLEKLGVEQVVTIPLA